MRRDIYYWKCDCPRTAAERATGFTAAKYAGEGIEAAVRDACRGTLGVDADAIEPLRCAGDHFAYRVTCTGRILLFRAAADATGDDYMLAESAAMALAAAAGVPVPRIVRTEAVAGSPLRWQLMEFAPGHSLRDLHRDGRLDLAAAAGGIGRMLRRLHAVPVDGFGFIDTAHLAATGAVRGLHARYRDYVACRRDEHLAYLVRHGLLGTGEGTRVAAVFARHAARFDLAEARLVHRDPALWNILGTADGRITALIDWDDVVGGDPADDLSILRCLHDRAFTDAVETAYWGGGAAPDGFEVRIRLHQLRNMLWKAQLRHQLGYFRPGGAAFLEALSDGQGVEAATRAKLAEALAAAEAA